MVLRQVSKNAPESISEHLKFPLADAHFAHIVHMLWLDHLNLACSRPESDYKLFIFHSSICFISSKMHLWLCCYIHTYILLSYTTRAHVHIHICTHINTTAYTCTHTQIFLVSPDDYTGISMTLGPFTSQRPRQCFSISIINDSILESNETFTARLTLVPASVTTITADRIIVDPPQTTVQITDNDLSKLIVVRVPSLKPRPHVCTCEGMDG